MYAANNETEPGKESEILKHIAKILFTHVYYSQPDIYRFGDCEYSISVTDGTGGSIQLTELEYFVHFRT